MCTLQFFTLRPLCSHPGHCTSRVRVVYEACTRFDGLEFRLRLSSLQFN